MLNPSKTSPVQHGGLVFFDAGIKVENARALPTRIVVAPWGTHQTAKGQITINETTERMLPGTQRLANFDRVALDFNHNTVPGSEAYAGEPAKIAANAVPLVVRGEGIVFDQVEWTPEGREHVGGGHYIDLSPTLQLNADGVAIFIHSAALCRQGAIPGLSLFSADPIGDGAASSPHLRLLLTLMLDLPETASDDQIHDAARDFARAHNDTPLWSHLSASSRIAKVLAAPGGRSARNMRLLNTLVADPSDIIAESIVLSAGLPPGTYRHHH